MTRTVWLLDIDGVVNVLPSHDTLPRDRWDDLQETVGVADGQEWPISYSPTLAREIGRIHHSGLAEVRWLTTWEHAAVALAAKLGLPQCVVAGTEQAVSDDEGGGRWWKLVHAERIADENDRIVWTDDDVYARRQVWDWAQSRADVFAPRVKPSVGISPLQLRAIEDWLRES